MTKTLTKELEWLASPDGKDCGYELSQRSKRHLGVFPACELGWYKRNT